MSASSILFIAGRSFFGKKAEGGGKHRERNYLRGAVLGVALSVVPLTVVFFVADGMIQGITNRYLETSTFHLQASPAYSKTPVELEDTASSIRDLPGVISAFPEFQGPAIVLGALRNSGKRDGSQVYGALVRAIDPTFLADPGLLSYLRPLSGELVFRRDNDVILGSSLAKKMGAATGDLVSFLTTRAASGLPGYSGLSPKLTTLRVRAIVSSGYEELDALWAFVPIATGERMLAPGTRRVFIGIKVKEPFGNLSPLRNRIEDSCVKVDVGSSFWSVATWAELERNLWKSFATTRALLVLLMALAVAVAAVNVGSALIMLSLEKKRDIAILKSAGASQSQIGAVFVVVGALTGGVGVVLGLAAGSLVAVFVNEILGGMETAINWTAGLWRDLGGGQPVTRINLLNPSYYLERIPVTLSISSLALMAILGIGLCILASLLPARKAAKLSPLEIIRKT